MNVLILGSGGREQAIAHKIADSGLVERVIIAPGNAGSFDKCSRHPVDLDNFDAVSRLITELQTELVIVGPEVPLIDGLSDFLSERHPDLHIVGPGAEGAQLEGSKDFAKAFMERHGIPTASYKTFTRETLKEGQDWLRENEKPPYVLKADGPAAGKGVLIIDDTEEACNALAEILGGKFGASGAKVVIESFLSGIECSVFVITDGKHYTFLPEAKDYKRIGEGDTGLNTGGMGAVSPVSFVDDTFMQKVEDRIVRPTIEGLQSEGIDYKGFIFFGLINCGGDPYVIEYNCRMGDPETEVVLLRTAGDLVPLFMSLKEQRLDDHTVTFKPGYATTVVAVSGGYPEKYASGKVITGLKEASDTPHTVIFHAGTATDENGRVVTHGGRVLAVSATGATADEALDRSYEALQRLNFEGIYYRHDIGRDLARLEHK